MTNQRPSSPPLPPAAPAESTKLAANKSLVPPLPIAEARRKPTVVASVPLAYFPQAVLLDPPSPPLGSKPQNRTQLVGIDTRAEPGRDHQRLRLTVGKVIPGTRYRILRWLGEGGMGVVYEAEHIDIERRVALKILRFDLSQQAKLAQVFRDEARAASRIGCVNIVEIYDFGELSDGRLFFCMELLLGTDLVPARDDDWTTPSVLIGLLRQCCKGLGEAHKHGIVHRDIKPENIIVVTEGSRGVVKIVDFGISAMLAADDTENTSIAGTPDYMAPEQISGSAFDGRLDMYALGCLAYELLVGHPPFDADSIDALLRLHLASPPRPPRQVRPDREIPVELEAVLMRCLEKDPAQRFRDMADLEAALCEAQISAKITTPWDDLPLPDVGPERRETLLRAMPSLLPSPELIRRSWLWPSLAGSGLVIAAIALVATFTGKDPNQAEIDRVEQLTIAARDAASKTRFVYPPPKDPDAPTAYRSVLQLEDLDGDAGQLGDQRGQLLRTDFAETLVGLGDHFWTSPDTKNFALDYYAQALLFDEGNTRARERSGLTLGMLSGFQDRAATGTFSTSELLAGRWLNLLATSDQDQLAAKIDTFIFNDEESFVMRSAGIRAAQKRGLDVDRLIADAVADAASPIVSPSSIVGLDNPTLPNLDADLETDFETDETRVKTHRGVNKRQPKKHTRSKLRAAQRDPEGSNALAEQAVVALRAGRREEARSLFNQAIAHDRRNARALMGLSDIAFDTGNNQDAVIYAEKSVNTAPKNQSYRLSLGDAYFKVLRYRDARTQYEKAKILGSRRADDRIAKVDHKTGRPSG